MKKLTLDDLDDLAYGCAVLGSGGGGEPTLSHKMARYAMERCGPASLASFSEASPEDVILPVGYIGAPSIIAEKILSSHEFSVLLNTIEEVLGKKVTMVMPYQIGGLSVFVSLLIGTYFRLPVLDADMMGRAFSESQMTSCHLSGISSPTYIVDGLGNVAIVHAKSGSSAERIERQIAIAMGSYAVFAFHPLSGNQVANCTIPQSISRAMAIGKIQRKAIEKGGDFLKAILKLCHGLSMGSGKIIDIIVKDLNRGTIIIQNQFEEIELLFQDEYLVAKIKGKVMGMTPDILMLLDQDTGASISQENLKIGLKVNLIALPAPKIWTTQEGLALVGPRKFGYNIDYLPINKTDVKVVKRGMYANIDS